MVREPRADLVAATRLVEAATVTVAEWPPRPCQRQKGRRRRRADLLLPLWNRKTSVAGLWPVARWCGPRCQQTIYRVMWSSYDLKRGLGF